MSPKKNTLRGKELISLISKAALDKKAENIEVLNLGQELFCYLSR
jgi:ribosomal silencing factor RsfS